MRFPAAALHVVSILGAASGTLAAETNLAPNGDLEAPAAADANAPAGWTPSVHGKTSVSWAAGEGRGGSRCLRMTAEAAEKWGHAYWISNPIRVRPCLAYRVRFHFRSKGHGVPCFTLLKVKDWRLFKGDTEGEWIAHEDVVVIPPTVTETRFSVNNYHRPGKTMWFDDLSIVELPLSASPLTKRLERARGSLAAIERNTASVRLTLDQRAELQATRRDLAAVGAGYDRLAKGAATAKDFQAIHDGLGNVEKAVGAYLFTVWVAEVGRPLPEERPEAVTRAADVTLACGADGRARCRIGAMALVDEPVSVRAVLSGDRKARDWPVRLLVTPAGRPGTWGEMGPLGTLLLPPGAPRLLAVEVTPTGAKPGTYAFALHIEGMDRTTEPGRVTFNVTVPGK